MRATGGNSKAERIDVQRSVLINFTFLLFL